MIASVLTMFLILAVGTTITDRLSVRLQEEVLSKLPVADASAFYDVLRRRARRTRILRAIALLSLLALAWAYRHRPA